MISDRYGTTIVLSIFIIAGFFRFTDLSSRPMHGDEAINAVKLSHVVETGQFDYKATQHHGPLLYFTGYLFSAFHGLDGIQDFSEEFLRSVTGFVGILLLWIGFTFKKSLQNNVLYLAFGLMAVSPSLVFYSRFFIHEIIIVFFSLGMIASGYQYLKTEKSLWLALTGVALGCMISTKETWPLFLIAMGSSAAILYFHKGVKRLISLKHGIIIAGIAVATTFLFYSDFFRDINNSTDAFLAFKPYLERVSSEGIHNHPWYFYLNIIFPLGHSGSWLHLGEGLLFLVFIFNLPLMLRSEKQPITIQFMFWYSLVLLLVFSAIPYKTPWNILGIMPGMIIVSANTIVNQIYKLNQKILGNIFIVLLGGLLMLQSYSYNFKNEANPANPYVYAHPTKDIFTIETKIHDMANVLTNEIDFSVFVMATGDDYWPFPWYLRDMDNVGYWNHVPLDVGSASVVLVSSDLTDNLVKTIYEKAEPGMSSLLIPLFDEMMELRPGVEISGYVKKDVYDLYERLSSHEG